MIFKSDFWVHRVANDEESRVLINPTTLLGACEIDKFEKFLLPLHSSNVESFLAVVIYETGAFYRLNVKLTCQCSFVYSTFSVRCHVPFCKIKSKLLL